MSDFARTRAASRGGSLPLGVLNSKVHQAPAFPIAQVPHPKAAPNAQVVLGIPDKVEQRVLTRQVCMQVPVPPGSAGRMICKGGSTLRAMYIF